MKVPHEDSESPEHECRIVCIDCASELDSVLHVMGCNGVRGLPVRVGQPGLSYIADGWAICLDGEYVRVQDMDLGEEFLCPVNLVQIQE